MFSSKKKKSYDKENLKPALRCSICTGEQVAGFKNIHTGSFEDVMLINGEKDLKRFMELYGLTEVPEKFY